MKKIVFTYYLLIFKNTIIRLFFPYLCTITLKLITMIKKLLFSCALAASFGLTAQNIKSIDKELSNGQLTNLKVTNSTAKTSTAYCDTLYNFNVFAPTTTLTLYTATAGTSCPTGGYVTGNNCYGTSELATFFTGSSYSSLTSPSVSAVWMIFYKNPATGAGTKGVATNTVGLHIYNGTMAGGPTGTILPLASTSATIGGITAAFSATSSIGIYQFNLATPVAVTPGGFFSSLVLPKVTGDTCVLFQQKSATTTSAWEEAGGWGDMKADWGGTINFEMGMFPIMGCSPLGMNNTELSSFFKVVPNPSNGVFSLISTLTNVNYDISVINMLGQEIMSKKNIAGAVVNDINLSNFNNGVYFVNITSGNNTITKKLVLNK
jgi:hypothetical protein